MFCLYVPDDDDCYDRNAPGEGATAFGHFGAVPGYSTQADYGSYYNDDDESDDDDDDDDDEETSEEESDVEDLTKEVKDLLKDQVSGSK